MPELTREEKLKLVEKLPQNLQDFLYSEDTGVFLLYLGQKYNLPNEKINLLSKLVGDVILKIVPITLLAQEINSKVTADPQATMSLAQELYTDLLSPIISETPTPAERGVGAMPVPQIPTPAPIPSKPIIPIPQPASPTPVPTPMPSSKFQVPSSKPIDRYRESTNGAPEIVDLRKMPPPPIQAPITAAPIPPSSSQISPRETWEDKPKPISPLTFTKPIEPPVVSKVEPIKPPPLIEAEPHKMSPTTQILKPQFIIRPPGLAPTDLPHDVLDLRKDKGEF